MSKVIRKGKGAEEKPRQDEYVAPEPVVFTGDESVKDLFLTLTSFTCPHFMGYSPVLRTREHDMYLQSLRALGGRLDRYGNIHILVGTEQPRTLFTCHLDTADRGNSSKKVSHVVAKSFIGTDGSTLLGADNKAGMTILIKMIKARVPGHYAFFLGEELGCYGSSWAAGRLDWTGYQRAIAFDREGYTSVITRQATGTCCSNKFAEALASQLNQHVWGELELRDHHAGNREIDLFRPDPTGRLTDTAMFVNDIPECTNISAGSFFSHQEREFINIKFLERLVQAATRIDWNALPTVRVLP